MAIVRTRCHVSGANITRIVDLEGQTINIICPEYDKSTGACRLKQRIHEGGPLARLLERVSEDTLSTRTIECEWNFPAA